MLVPVTPQLLPFIAFKDGVHKLAGVCIEGGCPLAADLQVVTPLS